MESSPQRRVGVYLDGIRVSRLRSYARRAESSAFSHLLFPEVTSIDPMTASTICAMETQQIRVMPAIAGIWSRSPVNMALTAATNHDLCPQRFVLGLGLQGSSYVEQWHGRHFRSPVTAMREYVTILRDIFQGNVTTFEGEVFHVRDFELELLPPVEIPIYVAAVGPDMVRLAGEIADGVIGYFYSPPYVEEVVIPNLKEGVQRAGRSMEDVDVAAGIPSVVTEDNSGIDAIKGQVLMFATATAESSYYQEAIRRAGFGEELEIVNKRVDDGDLRGALEAIPDEMANATTISGSVENALRRIQSYHDAGVNLVALNPSAPGVFYPLHEGHFPEGATLPEFDMKEYRAVIEQTLEDLGPRLSSVVHS